MNIYLAGLVTGLFPGIVIGFFFAVFYVASKANAKDK